MRQEKPLISVIVPVYNVEDYVEGCLKTIREQTYSNMEIIVVDDASTDRSGFVCDACAAQDARIQVVHLPVNRGSSAARNEGIRRARGDYISFVDADDAIEPDLLEKLYDNLSETGADVSACGVSGIEQQDSRPLVGTREDALRWIVWYCPFMYSAWGKLYDAELVKKHPFDERFLYCEDLLFLYQAFQGIDRFSYLPDKLCHYNISREGRLSQKGMIRRKCDVLHVLDIICGDAAGHFPELLQDFQRLALEINISLARETVEGGVKEGRVIDYLKLFRESIRRHFSRKAFWLIPRTKGKVGVLALYVSGRAFWALDLLCRKWIPEKNGMKTKG